MRHSKNISKNLQKAQAAELKLVIDKVFGEAETLFGQMAARKLRVNDIESFLEALSPRTEKQKKLDEEPERWARVRAVLNDRAVTPTATRDTMWGLYNAVVRAEDYRDAQQNEPARLERVWFGGGHDLKLKALKLAGRQMKKAA